MDTNNMIEELRILDDVTLFNTEVHYVIPRYQRAYAWEDKEIVQLIDDINDIDESEKYYIGSLVVSKVKDKANTYEVVDGQQRLTTLFLLLHYIASEGALEGDLGNTLSFSCRNKSNFTLTNLSRILKGEIRLEEEDNIEQSILNGIRVIQQKLSGDSDLNIGDFTSRLQHVILYRIEVPDNTDLNRYFEIMNTRGEQLEQHDILKAKLMGSLDKREEQEFFSRVWNACSDMTGYVQMHFSPRERENIFGCEWAYCPSAEWEDYSCCFDLIDDNEADATINEIIGQEFMVDDIDGTLDDDTHIRFESIIDFPYFLLHSLRVFVELQGVNQGKELADLLDDKKLIADFDNVVNHGDIDGGSIRDDKGDFAKLFIMHLLRMRYFFDKFIIKREYTGDDKEGEWSLKEIHTSGQGSKKKAYYSNTLFKYEYEREQTYSQRHKECMMIQSALRVSYTSPKVMHWITELLVWLLENDEYPLLVNKAENIAACATKKNFLDGADYKLGVQTPHVVFNFLDYLLWKRNKTPYSDFLFEFRNSVEHWYPQNPSEGSFDSWERRDTFGNLCIISRSVNSKFSNLSPESKMKSYGKMVKKGSLKLRIMGDIIEKGSNDEWVSHQCEEHEKEMIELLEEACDAII